MKQVLHHLTIELPDRFPEVTGILVTTASLFAWSASVFNHINHILETLVLLGSLGVSVTTIRYMILKRKKLNDPPKTNNPNG